jgi:hypothetical protein
VVRAPNGSFWGFATVAPVDVGLVADETLMMSQLGSRVRGVESSPKR